MNWYPTLTIHAGRLRLWLGRTKTPDCTVYATIDTKEEPKIGFKFHWLNDDIPMFSLILWPLFFATAFWIYPGETI